MYAVIDCGTTNTRVYVIDENRNIVGQGLRKVGVRNTSMTGSKDALRQGVCEAVQEAAAAAGIGIEEIEFAIASGMITSEIGLMEIPHSIAPVGLEELAANAKLVPGGEAIPLDIPILFIRGIRNDYGEANLRNIRRVDFMRGEETQMIGILDEFGQTEPMNVIVLSSHTKLIHANVKGQVEASLTTISGQLYEAVCKQTMIGKSLTEESAEISGGYSFEEIVAIADEMVEQTGLDRCLLIPRFMQVLLQTDYKERNLFIDASIAADDMKLVVEFEKQGYRANTYILFGHQTRCELYSYLIRKKLGNHIRIISISDKEKLSDLTVRGAIKIAQRYIEIRNKEE